MDFILAIVQARMGSTRMPGKVLKELMGYPLLGHIYERLSSCHQIRQTVVATSNQSQDQAIVDFCNDQGIPVFQGSENDVLDRFFYVSCKYKPQHIIRVTADCPLIDPNLVGKVITKYLNEDLDYCSIATGAGSYQDQGKGAFPDGLDCEIFRFSALEEAWTLAQTSLQREHVTPYIWQQEKKFKLGKLYCPYDYGDYRLTVDYPEDFALVEKIYQDLSPQKKHLDYLAVIEYLKNNAEVSKLNRKHIGNEGYETLYDQNSTPPV
jgi:spore coat polysaccharide biosynthesis protein SpsF